MAEICEKHGCLRRSCYICDLEEENKEFRKALEEIVNPSMEKWFKYKEEHGGEISFQEFLKCIAKGVLEKY